MFKEDDLLDLRCKTAFVFCLQKQLYFFVSISKNLTDYCD